MKPGLLAGLAPHSASERELGKEGEKKRETEKEREIEMGMEMEGVGVFPSPLVLAAKKLFPRLSLPYKRWLSPKPTQ